MFDYALALLSGNSREYHFWNENKTYLLNRLGLNGTSEPDIRFFRWFRWSHFKCVNEVCMYYNFEKKQGDIFYSSRMIYKYFIKYDWKVFQRKIPGAFEIKKENIPFFAIVHELVHNMQWHLGFMKSVDSRFYSSSGFNNRYAYRSCLTGQITYNIDILVAMSKTLDNYVTIPHEYDANVLATEIILEMQAQGKI